MTRKQFPDLLERKNKRGINQIITRKHTIRENNRETTGKRASQMTSEYTIKNPVIHF
jgi:hypothetical protein